MRLIEPGARRLSSLPVPPPEGLLGALLLVSALVFPARSEAQHDNVAATLHNLSASGPGEYHAMTETEVCKFCHIPHNAEVPTPLWSRRLSQAQYATPVMRRGRQAIVAPQPDGSSRLCLSCHDGTIALGEVVSEALPIAMAGGDRLSPGRKGFIGTDLTGSHPISIAVDRSDAGLADVGGDMGVRSLSAILGDRDVKLDPAGKMQCTTCHDPHSDPYYVPGRVPRFWVKPTVDGVCLTCHALR